MLWSLSEIGYDAEWHCIPASAVGAPHQRDRIWIVAYPNSERELQQKGAEQNKRGWACDCGENVAHANGTQCERGSVPSRIFAEDADFGSRGWWETEPGMGRVAYGVPNWTHRLKQLGNAVVPQIPELIGNMVMAHHVKISQEETNYWNNKGRN